jgi:site-specific recombinase XerD
MVAKADTDLKGLRDRALLLLGFAGAFRRSELVALNFADIEFCDAGLRVTIQRSKTDQEVSVLKSRSHGVRQPVLSKLRAWIKAAEICDGALFRPVARTGKVPPRRLSARASPNS